MIDYLLNIGTIYIEFVVFLDTQLSHLDIFVDIETCMFQGFLGTPHGTTINGDQHLARFCRFDHSTDMAPNTRETEIPANTLLSQPYGSLIGDLADIGATGTRKNQDFIRFAKAFVFHFFPPTLPLPRMRGGEEKTYLIHPVISSTFGTFPATFTTPSTTKAGVMRTP